MLAVVAALRGGVAARDKTVVNLAAWVLAVQTLPPPRLAGLAPAALAALAAALAAPLGSQTVDFEVLQALATCVWRPPPPPRPGTVYYFYFLILYFMMSFSWRGVRE